MVMMGFLGKGSVLLLLVLYVKWVFFLLLVIGGVGYCIRVRDIDVWFRCILYLVCVIYCCGFLVVLFLDCVCCYVLEW